MERKARKKNLLAKPIYYRNHFNKNDKKYYLSSRIDELYDRMEKTEKRLEKYRKEYKKKYNAKKKNIVTIQCNNAIINFN